MQEGLDIDRFTVYSRSSQITRTFGFGIVSKLQIRTILKPETKTKTKTNWRTLFSFSLYNLTFCEIRHSSLSSSLSLSIIEKMQSISRRLTHQSFNTSSVSSLKSLYSISDPRNHSNSLDVLCSSYLRDFAIHVISRVFLIFHIDFVLLQLCRL